MDTKDLKKCPLYSIYILTCEDTVSRDMKYNDYYPFAFKVMAKLVNLICNKETSKNKILIRTNKININQSTVYDQQIEDFDDIVHNPCFIDHKKFAFITYNKSIDEKTFINLFKYAKSVYGHDYNYSLTTLFCDTIIEKNNYKLSLKQCFKNHLESNDEMAYTIK